jgi:hypothetical protein
MYTLKGDQPHEIVSPAATYNCEKQVVEIRETSQNFFGSRGELYVGGPSPQTDERAIKIEKQGKMRGLVNLC